MPIRFQTFTPVTVVLAALALSAAGAPSAAAQEYPEQPTGTKTAVVCLEGIKGPSTRQGFEGCFEPAVLEFREARAAGASGAATKTVAMTVGLDQIQKFRRGLSGGATQARICVINGANICFEGPLEIVWICITTSQLAGYECPDFNEGDEPAGIVGLSSGGAR